MRFQTARIIVAFAASLVFGMRAAAAADLNAPQTVFLAEELTLSFVPEDVFFLVRDGEKGTMQRAGGVFVPMPARPGDSGQRFMAAARVPRGTSGELEYSVLAVGRADQVEMTPPRREELISRPTFIESPDGLHDEIAARRELLASFRLQVQTQEDSLRRLRQDAEIIGNFGRVMEVSDEVERLRAESAMIEQSAASAENLIKLASAGGGAKGSVAREGVLTRQLAELAEASKQAESAELSRKAGMEAELRSKLDIVEATRFDDPEALKKQLDELRAQRMKLEQSAPVAPAVPAPDNTTPLPVGPELDY